MPEGAKRRPPWLLLVFLAVGALLVYGGFSVYADQTSGIPGQARVTECDGGGKYQPGVHCRGTWTVGGSIGRGGRVVIGDVEGAGYGDVGETIAVRIHGGDRAVKPGLGTPIVLWVLGAPIVLLALFGLRGWWLAAVIALLLAASPAGASTIVFNCYVDLCGIDPETGRDWEITRDGRPGGPVYRDPSLSADGRLLAFAFDHRPLVGDRRARNRRAPAQPAGPPRNSSAPVLRARGHEAFYFNGAFSDRFTLTRLCRTPDVLRRRPRCGDFVSSDRGYFAWGPDRTILSIDTQLRQDICVTNLDRECRKVLVRLRGAAHFFMPPATSPDGRWIVATVERDQQMRLELFSARTGRRVRTLTSRHRDVKPAFSPDGRGVVFIRDAHGIPARGDICVVGIRGGRVRCPVERTREPDRPTWGG